MLPKEINDQEEDLADDICLMENKIYSNLVIPGFDRHLMPQVPLKSK